MSFPRAPCGPPRLSSGPSSGVSLMRRPVFLLALAAASLASPAPAQPADSPPAGLGRIEHIIVVYLENHSFDNLFGMFPGANGLPQGRAKAAQVDRDGISYKMLPPVFDAYRKEPGPDERFPEALPNRPFLIDRYVGQNKRVPDLVHRFYQEQEQI